MGKFAFPTTSTDSPLISHRCSTIISPEDLVDKIRASGIEEWPNNSSDAWALKELPLHHKDPFDRTLSASAISHNLIIVTAYTAFRSYPIEIKIV